MRKQVVRQESVAARVAPKEPLVERVIEVSNDSSGRRLWRQIDDKELVRHAKQLMAENRVDGKTELRKIDGGMYRVLLRRGLLDEIGFVEKKRNWRNMNNDELVAYTRDLMAENGVNGREELRRLDSKLYDSLRSRDLMDEIEFERKKRKDRDWVGMDDDAVVDFAQRLMAEHGISGVKELAVVDQGVYQVLRRRRLLDKVGFVAKLRKWSELSDVELVQHAKKFIRKNKINKRKELKESDGGLYTVLLKRKLMNEVFAEIEAQRETNSKQQAAEEMFIAAQELSGSSTKKEQGTKRKPRQWRKMTDDKLVEYAQRFMRTNEISRKGELHELDGGLYEVLRRRRLLDKVGFVEKQRKGRNWKDMSDDEIVVYAKRVMRDNDISEREELKKIDAPLSNVLIERGIACLVGFVDKQRNWRDMENNELIRYAQRFIDEQNIRSKTELQKQDIGLYNVLKKRRVMEKIKFKRKMRKRRNWSRMSDDEIVEEALVIIRDNDVENRGKLKQVDSGLCSILRKRNLFGRVGLEKIRKKGDRELIEYAQRFIEENQVKGRKELYDRNHKLYRILWERGLLDRVFGETEQQKVGSEQRAAEDRLSAVEELGAA